MGILGIIFSILGIIFTTIERSKKSVDSSVKASVKASEKVTEDIVLREMAEVKNLIVQKTQETVNNEGGEA